MYTTITKQKGQLTITLTKEGRAEIREELHKEFDDITMLANLLEEHTCNGWNFGTVDQYQLGLSEAPVLFESKRWIYTYGNYMIHNLARQLLVNGHLVFTLA